MASLPQQSSNIRQSQSPASESGDLFSEEFPQGRGTNEEQPSPNLNQNETVFPSSSAATESKPEVHSNNMVKDSDKAIQPVAATSPPTNNPEPRKCWICYTDETEDTPLNSNWRSPCPCALTAHEACLLDWLADIENPKSRKRNGRAVKLLCPQCKSEIVVSRPTSLIVDLVRTVERLAGRLVLPGMVFTLAGTVWAGCCAHGVYSMYFIFGPEDAQRIFDSGADATWNPRLNLGLPLIPIVLIFSRTRYAEGLLPAIPVLFFATHQPGAQELDMDLWPPSAAMTFAALPYAKSFYSMVYERLFGNLERRWIKEVQPRTGNEDTEDEGHQDGGHQVGNGDVLMEIDLELQVGMGEDGDIQDDEANLHAGVNQDVPNGAPEAGDGQQDGLNQAERQGNQILGRRQDELIHESSNLADTVLGALLFPAISASMGGVLKLALPKSWTTAPTLDRGKAGLLQSKWGRSVVGGCLFVLLKDALVLYCRWKLAQTHRKRRVLNYDRTKKRVVR